MKNCVGQLETNPNFKDSKMLINIHNKKHWKIVKSCINYNYDTIKQTPKFLNLSLYLGKLYLSLIGIILRWGFLIWELIFIWYGPDSGRSDKDL